MTDDRNPDVDLRRLINQLTQTHEVRVRDGGRHLGVRTDPALIVQLRRAKTSATTYATDPGASLRHERSIYNSEASKLYTEIEQAVRRWARVAGYDRTGDWPEPETLLRHWYARTYLDNSLDITAHALTCRGWTYRIRELLDPPARFDIDRPCPICRVHTFTKEADGLDRIVRALHGAERAPDLYRVTCRSCGATWDGLEAAQELADELKTTSIPVQHADAS
jgi:hypothetical protein